MKEPYIVQDGWSVPIQAPLLNESCFTPYSCKDNETVTAYLRVNAEIIKKYLEPTPFEYVNDIIFVYVSDYSNADPNDGYNYGYFDCGLVVQVKYKGKIGLHFLYEYENHDYAIMAGRELWGYPKKYAECRLQEKDDKIIGTVYKNGKNIIKITMDINKKPTKPVIKTEPGPHFLIKVVPKSDGPGIELKQILSRDTSKDFVTKHNIERNVEVELQGIPYNRLDEFVPVEILGGTYTIGDFYATETNGWAKIEETIISE